MQPPGPLLHFSSYCIETKSRQTMSLLRIPARQAQAVTQAPDALV